MGTWLALLGCAPVIGVVGCSQAQKEASPDPPGSAIAEAAFMDENRFWSLLDASLLGQPSQDGQEAKLADALRTLRADEIVAFEGLFARQLQKSYSWDLWGAAYIIHGGASDDGFEYFRRWLISRGRTVFESAVRDPDSLATLIPATQRDPVEFESFSYVAADVWKSKTGIDPITAPGDVGFFSVEDIIALIPGEPSGEPFEEDPDYLAKRWPKLWQRFGDNPLG